MAASTSAQDSTPNFRRQAGILGLDQKWVDALVNYGVSTLGRLAFAVTSPGQAATDEQVGELLGNALPREPITVAEITVMKRLIFESQTALIGSIRAQADPSADPLARRLPLAERLQRIADQRDRLRGLRLEGTLEVGHAVYDLVAGMMEADTLRYMAPSKAITRMQEITSSKPPKELRLDANGSGIIVKDVVGEKSCATSTELDVQEAMTRRALAFDAVGLIDFNVFQGWTSRLFQLMRQPAPPGFKEPSLTQLLRTDRQAFVRLQELSRDGIKPRADGTRPLDGYLGDMHNDSSVMFYMLPTQQRDRSRSPAKKASGGGWNKWSKNDSWEEKKSWKTKKTWEPKGGGKSYNSGKLPMALKGCVRQCHTQW